MTIPRFEQEDADDDADVGNITWSRIVWRDHFTAKDDPNAAIVKRIEAL